MTPSNGSEIKKITTDNTEYPELLKNIGGSPILYCHGQWPDQKKPTVAIVGTRKATQDGCLAAKRLAKELAEKGFVIVSGLALGIDAAAHEGALAGNGETIAVLANGVDQIYPRSHERLGEEILKRNGLLISEYEPGTPPYPSQFLARNRIISGLSLATIIIEAPRRSGALVTARWALDQGREVFVMPGNPFSQNYQGSHMLIRNGARLVTKAEDVIEDLGLAQEKEVDLNELEPIAKAILELIMENENGLPIDKIAENIKDDLHIVAEQLTYLVFEGLLEEKNGKFLRRR
ncbi:MAG: DNA-processing protein DprA [bacterium]|nr:DNA-processing protein DprA [bacterium]